MRAALLIAWLLVPAVASAQEDAVPVDDGPVEAEVGSVDAGEDTDDTADDEAEAAARSLFERGRDLFARGDYQGAVDAFLEAHELSGRGALYYNIYLAYERLGDLPNAIDYLERYRPLAHGEEQEVLQQRVETLRERYRAQLEEEERRRRERTIVLEQRVVRAGVPSEAVISLSVAGVASASWIVFIILSELEDQSLAERCGVDVGRFCSDDDVSTLRLFDIAADVSLGATVLAAGVGLAFLVIAGLADDEVLEEPTRVDALVGPNGAGLSVRGAL